jgi:hypothetical protein
MFLLVNRPQGDTARLRPQPNGQMEEGFTEPAKLADRVIAPGEGSAEPRVYGPKTQQSLRSWRQMLSYEHLFKVMMITHNSSICHPSVAHFVARTRFASRSPGSAETSPGAITLSASFAGSVSDLIQRISTYTRKLCQENKKLRTCYTEFTEMAQRGKGYSDRLQRGEMSIALGAT